MTHRSAAASILMAAWPMALMLRRTKSTSTSDAYLSSSREQGRTATRAGRRGDDVLLQLAEQGVDVVVVREADHDVQLFDLDVERVVVLAEEDAHLVREDVGPLLEQEVDVAQRDPLYLGRRGEQRD